MYTIGIKRRFWFGFTKHKVKKHGWKDGRLLVDFPDGSQDNISCDHVRVYPDFWVHINQAQTQQQLAVKTALSSSQITPTPVREYLPEEIEEPTAPPMTEAERRAKERVDAIMASAERNWGLPS